MEISDPVLLDSNILIYAYNKSSRFHKQALVLLKDIADKKVKGAITPQNLLEFYSISTDPKRVEKAVSPQACSKVMKDLRQYFEVIYPNIDSLNKLLLLIDKYKLRGARIFDAYLVATCISNGITNILTVNKADFVNFSEIKVIDIDEN